jgi:hypothetical protein
MTRSEYEQRRRALEAQLAADLELVRAAHEARLRALESLWRASPEEGAAAAPAVPIGTQTGNGTQPEIGTQTGTQAPPAAASPVRRGYGMIDGDVEEALDALPEVFDKVALVRELGYEPPRSTLHRVLQGLVRAGKIEIKSYSEGRTRTKYRKVRDRELPFPSGPPEN